MKKLIFDTSALNALAADPECDAIVRGMRAAYHIGLTETVLAEVVAHPDEGKRGMLLDLMERLLNFGMCVLPYQIIIEKQARAYQSDPSGYEWRIVDVRLQGAEEEVVRREFIHSVSGETRVSHRQADKDFRAIFSTAKPAFQKLFDSPKRPSLREVTDTLLGNGGAHLSIGANLVERATGNRPTEAETKDFMERCPPFKALLVALCFSQYDRCIRGDGKPSLGKAGRLDMFSSVYLAYCRVFLTNDEGQFKALTAVAELMEREMLIMMYDVFKANLCGLSAAAP